MLLHRLQRWLLLGIFLSATNCAGASEQFSATTQPVISSTSTTDSTTRTTTPQSTSSIAKCQHPDLNLGSLAYEEIEDVDIKYTSLDIYYPSGCGPFPVVFWIHGGGWSSGSRSNNAVPPKADLVNYLGAALVSIDYRLSLSSARAKWPDHGDDVASAIRFISEHEEELILDTSKISLIGHSSGAHLSLIVATDPHFMDLVNLSDETVDCVVALDTEGFRLNDAATAASRYVTPAFGTDPIILDDASPTVQVERNGAPKTRFLIITRGYQNRIEIATEFHDLINASGGSSQLLIANPYSHMEVNTRLATAGDEIMTPTVAEFLDSCTH